MTTALALDQPAARAATVEDARAAAVELYAASRPAVNMAGMSSVELVDFIGQCQAGARAFEAAQTLALARLAATEDVVLEDGTVEEVSQGLGYRRLDAPDLVSDALGLSSQQAGPKVDEAVILASKLPSLVDAIGAGRIDAYRAGVIASELREAPRAVCDEVLARVDGSLGKPSGVLRHRTRRALEVVDKQWLVTKTKRARSELGLRMVPNDDSTDTWTAIIPTEQSREAWAAVEPLAKQIRDTDGCTLDVARARAMTQLMLGNCSGTFHVHFAVPADQAEEFAARFTGGTPEPDADEDADPAVAEPEAQPAEQPADADVAERAAGEGKGLVADPADPVVVTGMGTARTTIVPRGWLEEVLGGQHGQVEVDVIGCDPTTGGFVTDPIPVAIPGKAPPDRRRRPMPKLATTAYRPTDACRAYVKARDQRCRSPGCTTSAYFTDLDHVRPWPLGPTDPKNLACLCRRHHRIKQRPGWTVRLNPDGTMDWTDPTGRVHTTHPVDHLGTTLPETKSPEYLTPRGRYSPSEDQTNAGFGDAIWAGDYNDPASYPNGVPVWLAAELDLNERLAAQRRRPPAALRPDQASPLEGALASVFHARLDRPELHRRTKTALRAEIKWLEA